jgi:hypothetical protein
MKKVIEIELNDDAVVKAVFLQTVGQVFPVMQMFYDNGKYFFTAYENDIKDITPSNPQLMYGGTTFA